MTLLDKGHKHTKVAVEGVLGDNEHTGSTLTNDGWTDASNHPLSNFCHVRCC